MAGEDAGAGGQRPRGEARPAVRLVGVSKRYAPSAPPALEHLTLDVAAGELLFLVGPSGSGKTTTLRLIAGYERPDAGAVLFDETPVDDVPAHRRRVGMVYQHYALFPHMTVAQNVAFGLRMRGAPRAERAAAVAWALDLVRLGGLEGRYPRQLSGGQQQRVALARALAFRPALLLLDEPLANLDRHLRAEMRLELKALQRRLGVTTVFVTHDQEEAMALADRVAVLDRGRLQQAGAPGALYHRPHNGFVARFLGEMNILPGTLEPPATPDASAVPGAPGALDRSRPLDTGVSDGPAAGVVRVYGVRLPVRALAGARLGALLAVCLRAEGLRLGPHPPAPPPAPRAPASGRGGVESSALGSPPGFASQAPMPSSGTREGASLPPAGTGSVGGPGEEEPQVSADGWRGTVRLVTYMGAGTHYLVDLDPVAQDAGTALRVCEPGIDVAPAWDCGARVLVRWVGGAVHALPPEALAETADTDPEADSSSPSRLQTPAGSIVASL